MIRPKKLKSSKTPTRSEKKRILVLSAASDLAAHLSSLDAGLWEIEKTRTWPEDKEFFLVFVDALLVKPEEIVNRVCNCLTVYLHNQDSKHKKFTFSRWVLAFPRERFLKSDIHFTMALLRELRDSISYAKRLEANYQPFTRQAQLGEALQGIVHNVNNQMTSVLGFLEIIQLEHLNLKELNLVYEHCQRLRADFANLLRVSRRDIIQEVSSFDLNAMIREELRLLMGIDPLLRNRIVCKTHLDADLPPLFGIYSDFSHSFLNLIRNATFAMTEVDNPQLTIRTSQNKNSIYLEVEDQGLGIPERYLEKIFKPYFSLSGQTNNHDDSGLGLGLSTSKELLDKYGVKWEVESRVGVGTRFVLNFPRDKVCRSPESRL